MHPIFTKLNYKAQPEIVVINAPDEFLPAVEAMRPLATIVTDPGEIQLGEFMIGFAKTQSEVDAFADVVGQKLEGDGIVWIAYPKGSSRKYNCDFNRDSGWEKLGKIGFEPVRQVAIDDDWSALRFRRTEHIKKMTRSHAISETGKSRIGIGENASV